MLVEKVSNREGLENTTLVPKENHQREPFTEIWHNNKPPRVIRVRDIRENKCVCLYSRNEFPRGPIAVVSSDITLAPGER